MILPALLVCYQFSAATTSNFHYHQQTFNLIENIISWHNSNTKFWWIVASDEALSDWDVGSAFLNGTATPKIVLSNPQVVNLPQTRDFAAIIFVDSRRIESQLALSLKLPTDVIKFYLDHNGCQLNETMLAEIMNRLWRSGEIGFIYYVSFCSLSTARNYDSIDNGQQAHKDNYDYAINLFYHQPFVENKSGQWGVLERVDLINDREGGSRRSSINMASQVFHYFPFRRKHSLKLNRLNMTVILFTSTKAYHKSEMEIFRGQLSQTLLDDPLHHVEAYFGQDAELLRALQVEMNFTLTLSPTSDRQLFGFKVSFLWMWMCL